MIKWISNECRDSIYRISQLLSILHVWRCRSSTKGERPSVELLHMNSIHTYGEEGINFVGAKITKSVVLMQKHQPSVVRHSDNDCALCSCYSFVVGHHRSIASAPLNEGGWNYRFWINYVRNTRVRPHCVYRSNSKRSQYSAIVLLTVEDSTSIRARRTLNIRRVAMMMIIIMMNDDLIS